MPPSGSMFALGFDPFLRDLQERIDNEAQGITKACADDVIVLCYSLAAFLKIDEVFTAAAYLANLKIKFEKCVIIPFGGGGFYIEAAQIIQYLSEFLPSWLEIRIMKNGSYLGFVLGRDAKAALWEGPLRKWSQRSAELARSGAPVQLLSSSYRKLCITCLQYVAQLAVLPQDQLAQEAKAQASLLRYPFCALPAPAFEELIDYNGPSLPLVFPSTLAALLRFALSEDIWLPCVARLRISAEAAFPAADFHAGRLSKADWGSEPFASTLAWAHSGFPLAGFGSPLGRVGALTVSAGRRRWERLHRGASEFLREYHQQFPEGYIPGGRFPPPEGRILGKKILAAAREKLRDALYDKSLFGAWRQRALKWFEVTAEEWAARSQASVQQFLSEIPKMVAQQLIRTWSFAWVTSSRFHDTSQLPCALGCPGAKDSQAHYFRCPSFWQPVAALSGYPVPPGVAAKAAFGLNFGDAHNVALVTNAFHTARRNPAWRRNIEDQDFDKNKILWESHLRAARSRFSDIHYPWVAFSRNS